jgi:hypothetical protein
MAELITVIILIIGLLHMVAKKNEENKTKLFWHWVNDDITLEALIQKDNKGLNMFNIFKKKEKEKHTFLTQTGLRINKTVIPARIS